MELWHLLTAAGVCGAFALLLRFARTKHAADTLLQEYEQMLANPPAPKKK